MDNDNNDSDNIATAFVPLEDLAVGAVCQPPQARTMGNRGVPTDFAATKPTTTSETATAAIAKLGLTGIENFNDEPVGDDDDDEENDPWFRDEEDEVCCGCCDCGDCRNFYCDNNAQLFGLECCLAPCHPGFCLCCDASACDGCCHACLHCWCALLCAS